MDCMHNNSISAASTEPIALDSGASYDGMVVPVLTVLLSTIFATSIAVFVTWIANKKQVNLYVNTACACISHMVH